MEEHVVPASDSSRESGLLRRRHNGEPISISDSSSKYWVLSELNQRGPELTATMLQLYSISQQVTLLVSTYIPQSHPGSGQLMVLGIKGTNYFLSCRGPPNSPVLKLETVADPENSLKTISMSSDTARFLFYKRDNNTSSTLESFLYPGWFISNHSCNERSPVTMCRGITAAGRVAQFHLSRVTNSLKPGGYLPV
ncbi:interleukin-1 beta-like [Polyodon spathula]|uniref:interleukin-1 beta-like n=1 Tax=Polyodon spathula TaxID=7913 RepID=UPI001B7E5B59|nr:interleukin-1 beta-like [Polyodon spathula]